MWSNSWLLAFKIDLFLNKKITALKNQLDELIKKDKQERYISISLYNINMIISLESRFIYLFCICHHQFAQTSHSQSTFWSMIR